MKFPGFEEVADQVWRRRGEGPKLAVIGSIHGDEDAGAAVIHELLRADDRLWRRAGAVDLTLAIGNPRALEQGVAVNVAAGKVVRFMPALNVPEEDLREGVDRVLELVKG